MSHKLKEEIENTVKDLVSSFLYYDRKEDEDLPRGAIDKAVKSNLITEKEIVELFAKELHQGLKK